MTAKQSAPLPQDLDAERGVLGSMLLDPAACHEGLQRLTAEAFMHPRHRVVFGSLAAMAEDGIPADLITMKAHLIREKKLTEAGGVEYLVDLAESVPSIANLTHYADILVGHQRRRELNKIAHEIANNPGMDADSILQRIDACIANGGLSGKGKGMSYPEIIPAAGLGTDAAVNWVWHGYVASGSISLLTGLWKCGKSTLVSHLLKALEDGGTIGGTITPCPVLVITEESRTIWANRRDTLGLTNNADFIVRPFRGKPGNGDWTAFVAQTTRHIVQKRYGLVIVDPLANILPIVNENDAAEVMTAILPLTDWAESGAGVLLCHHPRKGDATEGQAARGSGALSGFVDILIELRRFSTEDRDDTRRVLTTYSRFDESPAEQVLDLTPIGYRCTGTKAETSQEERLTVIRSLLPSRGEGVTVDAIYDAWPEHVRQPSKRSLFRDLDLLVKKGRARKFGTGKRSDPFSFLDTPLEGGVSRIENSAGCDLFPDSRKTCQETVCQETGGAE